MSDTGAVTSPLGYNRLTGCLPKVVQEMHFVIKEDKMEVQEDGNG